MVKSKTCSGGVVVEQALFFTTPKLPPSSAYDPPCYLARIACDVAPPIHSTINSPVCHWALWTDEPSPCVLCVPLPLPANNAARRPVAVAADPIEKQSRDADEVAAPAETDPQITINYSADDCNCNRNTALTVVKGTYLEGQPNSHTSFSPDLLLRGKRRKD